MTTTVEERRAAIEARHPRWVETSLDSYFELAASAYGDRPYVITDDETLRYRDVWALSQDLARGLDAQGLKPGDRVGIIMANFPIVVPLLFAIWRLGLVAVPFNTLYRADELAYVIRQSRCNFLITMGKFRGQDFLAHLDRIEPEWRQDRFETCRDLKGVAVYGDAPQGVVSFDKLLNEGRKSSAPIESRSRALDTAIIMYTSGTTGSPKGVMLTHDNVLRCAYTVSYHHAFQDGRRAIFSLPLYHVFGVVQGVIAGLVVGGAIIPHLKFDAPAILTAVGRHHANYLMVVPTMMLDLLAEAKRGSYDFSSLTAIHNGAAPTPVWVWRDIVETFGCGNVFTSFGQTETTALIMCTQPGDPIDLVSETQGVPALGGAAGLAHLGGRIAAFKIVDPITGAERAPGESGEICTRGPLNCQGYFERPEETAKLFTDDGWLRTGDIGLFRADGYMTLTGRAKELYKSGGELVSPKEVEDVLTRHAEISQAFVVGIPDARWGETGCAFIVRAEGSTLSSDDVLAYLASHLARFKLPSLVSFISADALPKTGTGKVQKAILREQAIALARG